MQTIKTKLQAIEFLNNAMKHNKKFKQKFTDYVELSIIEALEECKIEIPLSKLRAMVKKSSEKISEMFDPDWAEMAFDLNPKKPIK